MSLGVNDLLNVFARFFKLLDELVFRFKLADKVPNFTLHRTDDRVVALQL